MIDDRDDLTYGLLHVRHVPGETRSAYNNIYERGAIHNLHHHHDHFLDLMGARPGMRMLDVACGEAGLVLRAYEVGVDAHGVDLSATAIKHGKTQLPESALVVGNGEALPYADCSFDRVVNIGSLEHYLDPVLGAAEMSRVMKPDGLGFILLPNTYGFRWTVLYAWRHGDVFDDGQPLQRFGTRLQWVRLLEAGGFKVERVIGYESQSELPTSIREAVDMLRHPTRLMIPLARFVPLDMASMHIFFCRKLSAL
jgi:SAM-dependent methyltransferase